MDIENSKMPVHVGFIMDGNGRWALKRGLPRTFGHREGAKAFKKIVDCCLDMGIRYATFYAFSTENWSRPKEEVDELMKIFDLYLDDAKQFADRKIRLVFIGDKSPFPEKLRNKMTKLEADSAEYDRMTVLLAMNYGGRADIVYAAKRAAELTASGDIRPEDIDEKMLGGLLYTGGIPDADLIIRPSGEQRLSNFLLWQAAYAELYFADVLWPDFDKKELQKAVDEFAGRSRRFGGV